MIEGGLLFLWSTIQGLLKLNAALLFAVGLTTLALRHPSPQLSFIPERRPIMADFSYLPRGHRAWLGPLLCEKVWRLTCGWSVVS